MLECQVGMQSDTHARKAQAILRGYGYPSTIRRNVKATPEGCSYVLSVKGDCTSVSDILVESRIPYLSLRNVRGTT